MLRQRYPSYCLVLTFFSPSGYEVKKNYEGADHIFYLPLDTRRQAERFISLVQPACALFVKYEFWYHYLHTLHRRAIPAILFSALFQERQPFFKWYGGLYRKMLHYYKQIFVQDEASLQLLRHIGITHTAIAGDTRFDRAAEVAGGGHHFPALDTFKGSGRLLVAGSTWREDEVLLQQAWQQLPEDYKLLIAPHETGGAAIARIRALFPGESCLWTGIGTGATACRVCIVDTVGQLAYLYRYADVVWIGGGFTRSGIHNIIEPAVFGKPVFFGPVYDRYREARAMIEAEAAASVATASALCKHLEQKTALLQMGYRAGNYVRSQLGATDQIVSYLTKNVL